MKLFLQGIILSTLTLTAAHANNEDAFSTPRGQSTSNFVPEAPVKSSRPTEHSNIERPIHCSL